MSNIAAIQGQFKAPFYLVWEITLLCNASCVHCYSGAGRRHPDELDAAEALSVVDQLAEAGVLLLGLSGGEALLRPDWMDIASRASSKGMMVSIGTNGAVIDDEMCRRIIEAGVSGICVSIDGATAEVHEQVRGVKGLYDKAVSAIETLVKHGINVTVGYTPTRLNFRDGRRVVELAARLGANGVNLSEFIPTGRGDQALALTPNELRDVIVEWISMQQEYAGKLKIYWHDCRVALMLPPEQAAQYIGCGAGYVTARITVNGDVTPCVTLPLTAGNLREQSFQDIWSYSPVLANIRDRTTRNEGNCGTCEHKFICGGCRSAALAYHNDASMGDPYCWVVPEAVQV
ncbi:radical SAM protein [Paenibacillus sp. FSL L8-0470]|uniref:radical SAM/SPASM domain-containing protein n=1 Tax=Paenibacillus sp. FSL L8-0470 TaxID=2954688 RepID=UPI0030F8008B